MLYLIMHEIEMKAKIINIKEIKEALHAIATFQKIITKDDTYFIHQDSKDSLPLFRLRQCQGENLVTYKKRSFEDNLECNEEIEFKVDDEKSFIEFVSLLGYEIDYKKTKTTTLYRKDNISYEVNHVEGLGDFLELECLTNDINNKNSISRTFIDIFNKLGIKEDQIVKESYTSLIKKL